jgi:CheY-like chemotaxis protein
MPKVMLVEDDNNLREIYEARLTAEGYQTVSAHDGEEALALAVKERPDLIISDVMMPKISGFDMLDILRSTPETKNTKVIMMTALGQAEDRDRADKLGADRYLVKSQVTLEDVIKVAHEVLDDTNGAAPATPAADATPPTTTPPTTPTTSEPPTIATPPAEPVKTEPAEDKVAPLITATPPTTTPPAPAATTEPPKPVAPIGNDLTKTGTDETKGVEQQIQDFIANNPTITASAEPPKPAAPAATTIPVASAPTVPDVPTLPIPPTVTATPAIEPPTSAPVAPPTQDQLANPTPGEPSGNVPEPPSHKKLVLQPTENATAPPVDLNALLAKEDAKEGTDQAVQTPAATSVITPQTNSDSTPAAAGTPGDIAL